MVWSTLLIKVHHLYLDEPWHHGPPVQNPAPVQSPRVIACAADWTPLAGTPPGHRGHTAQGLLLLHHCLHVNDDGHEPGSIYLSLLSYYKNLSLVTGSACYSVTSQDSREAPLRL